MKNEITMQYRPLATMIAEKVMADICARLPEIIKENTQSRKYIRGNKALAEFLGVSPITVCEWKNQGILQDAIKSEYGRVIIYEIEKVLECLNHKTLKSGRPKINRK